MALVGKKKDFSEKNVMIFGVFSIVLIMVNALYFLC